MNVKILQLLYIFKVLIKILHAILISELHTTYSFGTKRVVHPDTSHLGAHSFGAEQTVHPGTSLLETHSFDAR